MMRVRIMDMFFTDFAPAEEFKFSVDLDPTAIKGTTWDRVATAPDRSPASSQRGDRHGGLSTTARRSRAQCPHSVVAGGIEELDQGVGAGGTGDLRRRNHGTRRGPTAAQTIRVSGPANAAVRLLRVDGDMDLNGGAGFDVDPFEASTAVAVGETSAVIGAGGFVDMPVTLTQTADDGFNYFMAAIVSTDGTVERARRRMSSCSSTRRNAR